ncbi:sensor histidine kinase [Steroidobacter sp. S1-65]|uniref:histidine kinase n=1 Tax=Steroidobacter gossypii TaxID=2805490 RepID=A0ABS1X4G0_9GAMM|nr:sensor histidine kinase [Steroidobacter gossypii]MBM0108109.1 sensor histidine kinase [Steroidobacter gossypii]
MPRSLRVRLLLSAAIAIFLALAAAWVAMTLLFERHVERRIEADLIREGLQLAAALSIAPDGTPALEQEPGDARFFEPASGLYWQVTTGKGAQSSRSLWDQHLPAPVNASSLEWRNRIVDGPFDQQILLVERIIRPERSGADVLIQLAHEQKSLHDARQEFGNELAMFLAMLWLILAAASWVQVELGLRPLRHVRNEVETLKRNPRERITAAHVAEIEPLTLAINELADAREKDLSRARRRAADLAHGLKTPLAALSAQSRRAREAGATEAADGLDQAIAAARAAIEGELARSRAAAIRAAPSGDLTPALPLIESLVGVVEKTEFGSKLVFEVNIPDELRLPVASEDLLEIAGALIENAARYAHRRVRITGESAGGGVLLVEDDGPGIGPEKITEALMRGGRLDEAGSGHGLGLAIANDLVEATRGAIMLTRSDLGGLKVTVAWPASDVSALR